MSSFRILKTSQITQLIEKYLLQSYALLTPCLSDDGGQNFQNSKIFQVFFKELLEQVRRKKAKKCESAILYEAIHGF